jgi:hypothetical protein
VITTVAEKKKMFSIVNGFQRFVHACHCISDSGAPEQHDPEIASRAAENLYSHAP